MLSNFYFSIKVLIIIAENIDHCYFHCYSSTTTITTTAPTVFAIWHVQMNVLCEHVDRVWGHMETATMIHVCPGHVVMLQWTLVTYVQTMMDLHRSLPATVHFQHSAELVKLLSASNVNYTLQVSVEQPEETLMLCVYGPELEIISMLCLPLLAWVTVHYSGCGNDSQRSYILLCLVKQHLVRYGLLFSYCLTWFKQFWGSASHLGTRTSSVQQIRSCSSLPSSKTCFISHMLRAFQCETRSICPKLERSETETLRPEYFCSLTNLFNKELSCCCDSDGKVETKNNTVTSICTVSWAGNRGKQVWCCCGDIKHSRCWCVGQEGAWCIKIVI